MTLQKQDNIDRYIWDKMPKAERKAFETAISNDPDLRREVLAQKEAMKLVEGMGEEVIKARIRKAGQKGIPIGNTVKSKKGFWALSVALLIALAIAGFYFLQKEEASVPSNIIYASHFTPYDLTFGNRGNEDLLTSASIAYAQKDYTQALELFAAAAPNNEDAKIALAQGISRMALAQFDQAIPVLAAFVEDPLYGAQCRWYLALAYLQSEQKPAAKKQLELLIQSPEDFKKVAAQEILKKMK